MKKLLTTTTILAALSSPAYAFWGTDSSSQSAGFSVFCHFTHSCGVPEYDDAHEWSWQYGSNVGKKSHKGYEFDGINNGDFYQHVVQDLQSTITEGSVTGDKPIVNFDGYGQTQWHVAGFKYEQYGYNYEHNPGGQDHHINNVDVQVVSKYNMNTAHGANYTVDGYDKVADAAVTTRSTHVTWVPHSHDDWQVGNLGWVTENTVQKKDHLIASYEAVDYQFSFDIDAYAPKNIHQTEWDTYVFSDFDVVYSDGHTHTFNKEWVTVDNANYRDAAYTLDLLDPIINRDGALNGKFHGLFFGARGDVMKLSADQKKMWIEGGGTGANVSFEGSGADYYTLSQLLPNAAFLTEGAITSAIEAGINPYGWTPEQVTAYGSIDGIKHVEDNGQYGATIYSDYHKLNDTLHKGAVHIDYEGQDVYLNNVIGVGSEVWADGANNGRLKVIATAAVISSLIPQADGTHVAEIVIGTSDNGMLNLSEAVTAAKGHTGIGGF